MSEANPEFPKAVLLRYELLHGGENKKVAPNLAIESDSL